MDDLKLLEKMKELATCHIELMAEPLGVELDYSEKSLENIDEAIKTFHADGFLMETSILCYSAYVGEVIRLNLGGNWIHFSERDENGLEVTNSGTTARAYPITWVSKSNADDLKDSISNKYISLKRSIGIESELSDHVPKVSVEKAAQTQVLPRDEPSNPEVVMRGAATVFMLIAAADGSIDKKEAIAFQKTIDGVQEEENALFQASLMHCASDPAANLEYHDNSLQRLAELMLLRRCAEGINADLAYGYCESLYDMAVRVASASGGFLGVGSIDQAEQAVLDVMQKLLRIGDPTPSPKLEESLASPPIQTSSAHSGSSEIEALSEDLEDLTQELLLKDIGLWSIDLKSQFGVLDPCGRLIDDNGNLKVVPPTGLVMETPMTGPEQIAGLKESLQAAFTQGSIKGYVVCYDASMNGGDAFIYELVTRNGKKTLAYTYAETSQGIELGSLIGL